MISSSELRRSFLTFFAEQGHEVVPSSSLVPANDPTLLFTNAGMVPFKDVFLGRETRPYTRAASSQRCVRAGGKHNDLENVGYTARHHTFFEMLGNFSFGDYFKRDAIRYAWTYLTEVLELPPEKLWVTVFTEDDEAADIWLKEVGVDPARFARIGAEDNFWSMGDTGPCGPCSEIFYDHGPDVPGGPPGTPEADGDRYVEIWNLVFMQYNRDADGNLTDLPKPSVDTGMGLERLAAVLQGVHSNYEIDLFRHLMQAVADIAGLAERDNSSLRVIADHIRSSAFLVLDGVLPSNEGRGYVLRRIIRRAARHGYRLGLREPFFHRLVAPLAREMGDAYPELARDEARVERVLRQEETRFAETLEQGLRILDQAIADLQGKEVPGDVAFRLYDTYGFPVDLTADIARERGLTVDMAGFEAEMAEQRRRARAASRFEADYSQDAAVEVATEFTGYDGVVDESPVRALVANGEPVEHLSEGQEGWVFLDATPFYAESGGQVGDRGLLRTPTGEFEVLDTRKAGPLDAHAHIGRVRSGEVRLAQVAEAHVDAEARQATARNHSATHLLNAALRQVLGEHVAQKGSLVAPDRLRFDFSHDQPLTADEIDAIETLVNREILRNHEAETRVMPLETAVAEGALTLAGEKYSEAVRVLRLGDFSMELCGGTHVCRTGDIGLFKIVSESGVAAGVRRIEAYTGERAFAWLRDSEAMLRRVMDALRSDRESLDERLSQLLDKARQNEREIERLKGQLASQAGSELADRAETVDGVRVLAAELPGADPKTLRDTVDQLRNKLGTAAVVLATVADGKVRLVAGVTRDATDRIRAGELVNAVAERVGGRGGGRPDMAQAGGTEPAHLAEALAAVPDWVRARLNG